MSMAKEAQFHVLAVDDSLIDRKLIERLLKNSSYHVTAVDSGSKALEFLGLHEDNLRNSNPPSVSPHHSQEIEINLIITDYCMPGMTGYDLLKRIKESSSLKDIPVVIMSSENVPSRINRCIEEGAEEFFLKPVQLSDMKRLQPHLLKGKFREQQQELLQLQLQQQQPQSQQPQQLSQQQPNNKRKAMEEALSPERTRPRLSGLTVEGKFREQQQELLQLQLQQQQPQSQQPQQLSQQQPNNKRKAMEEALSPERTRPRLSGLTVV